jgi:hypothetical protein
MVHLRWEGTWQRGTSGSNWHLSCIGVGKRPRQRALVLEKAGGLQTGTPRAHCRGQLLSQNKERIGRMGNQVGKSHQAWVESHVWIDSRVKEFHH